MQPFLRHFVFTTLHLIVIASLLFIFQACKSEKKEAVYLIPNTAQTVVKIDLGNATKKAINIHTIFDFDFLKELYALGELPNNKKIQESGLDVMKPIYFFIDSLSAYEAMSVDNYAFTVVGNLMSESIFRRFVEDFDVKIETQPNDFYLAEFPKGYLAWNKQIAVFSYFSEEGNLPDIKKQVVQLIQLEEKKQLISTQPEANKVLTEKNDIAIWSILSPIFPYIPVRLPKSLPVQDILASTQATLAIHFEKGEVVANGTMLFADKRMKKMVEAFKDSTSLDLIETIPGEKPLTVLSMKLNLPILYQLLLEYELAPFLDQYLFFIGTNCQEIFSAFDGNIVVALIDTQQKLNQHKANVKDVILSETYIGLGIADDKKYTTLMQNFEMHGIINHQNGYYYSHYIDVSVMKKDNYIAIVTSPFLRESILKNNGRLDTATMKQFDQTTAQFFARTQGLASNVMPNYAHYTSELDNMYCKFYSENNQVKMKARVKMLNEQQNSLVTFIQLMKKNKQQKKNSKPPA